MDKYPRIISYLVALPILGMTVGLYAFQADPVATKLYAVFELCYACLIISFLGGSHWQPALKDRNNLRITLALLPVILCAGLLFWGFTRDPNQPLLGVIALFWGTFLMDKKYYDMRDLPENYLMFRFNFTVYTTAMILFSYLVVT